MTSRSIERHTDSTIKSRAFHSSGVPAALLDAQGVIVDTNEVWNSFVAADLGAMGNAVIGVDFVELSNHWSSTGAVTTRHPSDGIREVLARERTVLVFEYPSMAQQRRLLLRVIPTSVHGRGGAVVFHTDVLGPTLTGPAFGAQPVRQASEPNTGPADPAERPERLPSTPTGPTSLEGQALLLDAVGEAVLVLDPDGNVSYLNRAAEQVYGWSAEEALGRSVAEVGPSNLSSTELRDVLDHVRSGRDWSGDLVITRRSGLRFPAHVTASALYDGDQVVAIISSTVDMSDRAEAEAEATYLATHDGLTGLRNRPALIDALDRALDDDTKSGLVSVLLLDLDEFRLYNEALGLDAGDQLLGACARALSGSTHAGDTVARFSGDTFAVSCPHLADATEALALAEQIRTEVSGTMRAGDLEVDLRSTVGLAVSPVRASWSDPIGADLLLHQAEAALQAGKDRGGQQTAVFDHVLRERLRWSMELDSIIRAAVAAGEVRLAYQPVTRLSDGEVVGAEALLRVSSEDRAAIAPPDAIAAAERIGLGHEFGMLVIRTACEEAARWQQLLPERKLSVSVNLSAHQLGDLRLPDGVRLELDHSGLEPARLGLEVSESILMSDGPAAGLQLGRLRMLGVHLSADDFGSGYSSLAALKRLPLDTIKADISFVSQLPDSPEDVAILSAMIGVADALGLQVVAKGVENDRQLAEVERLGCTYGQGFYWSRDLDGDGFLELACAPNRRGEVTTSSSAGGDRAATGRSRMVEDDLDVVFRSLAHEVRTPLTVVMGYASLLESTLEGADAQAARSIRRASEQMGHLIRNLEDVLSIDKGDLCLDAERLDLSPLVTGLATELTQVFGRSVAVIRTPPEPAEALVDRKRVLQVLTNLVSNAVKFSPSDSPVAIVVDGDDDWIEVSVADEGAGIAIGDLGLVYRKYARVDRSRPGSGLGLYLARGTARAHGGDITYRRRLDRDGSIFGLRLPRAGGAARLASGPAA